MREIKFRVLDKKSKQVRFFQLAEGDLYELEGFILRSEGVEIMQSTGLKDKNGKEIYEGDIVKIKMFRAIEDWDYENFVVVWQQDAMRFGLRDTEQGIKDSLAFTPSNDFEIIGNIYENADLLTT